MSTIDTVKGKIQRILADQMGSVTIDRDGDFVVTHESAVTYVNVYPISEDEDADIIIRCYCPMVKDVPLTPELTRWVSDEGQRKAIGSCYINPDEDGKTCWVYFRYSIVGNDLDPNELLSAVYRTVFTANDLDDMLKEKFGGKLFNEE